MNDQRLAQCRWPRLAARYAAALRAAAAYVLDRFDPQGIVVSGTIIRGHPDPASDLDVYVIHDAPWRQRVQKFFQGVPAEIFVNPPHQIERYFEEERLDGRPSTAHMLATGFIVLDVHGQAAAFQQRARQVLQEPPTLSADQRLTARYMAALAYEDAADIAAHSPENASLILGAAVADMLRYAFLSANRALPRQKEFLTGLQDLDPDLCRLAYAFYNAASTPERLTLAGQIADRTIGARGFFEWESPPQDVPPE
jgi:hypothetical protein